MSGTFTEQEHTMSTTTITAKSVPATKAAVTKAGKGTTPTKAQQAATTKALTTAQNKSLDLLVSAVKASVAAYTEADNLADQHRLTALTQKVMTVRAIGKLNEHPAIKATRGTKAGEPALTKVAALTGFKPATLEPLFKAAEYFRKQGWHKRTTAVTDAERDAVAGYVKSEAERAAASRAEKSRKSGTKGPKAPKASTTNTKLSFDSIKGQITALTESMEKFTKDAGFSNAEADELATALDALHDMIERATTPTK